MPSPAHRVAVWAQSCSAQLSAGEKLVDVLEKTKGLPRRAVSTTIRRLQQGQPISKAFYALHPHLRYSDIALIQSAQKAGSLEQGLALLADQYFLRARVFSLLMSAFVYPISILVIGLLLMNLQSLLYNEASVKTAGTGFLIQLILVILAWHAIKRLLAHRPPILQVLMRQLPFFRTLSTAMAMQRFTWVLSRSSEAALPLPATATAAADASGSQRLIRRAEKFQRAIGLGDAFPTAFAQFLSPCPEWVKQPLNIRSPNHIQSWAQPIFIQSNEVIENATTWIQRIAKPVALMIMVPLIFLVMKNQWLSMVEELRGNSGWFF